MDIETVINSVVGTTRIFDKAKEPETREWRAMKSEWREQGHDWPFVVVRGIAYEKDEADGHWWPSFDPSTITETGKGWQPAEWWRDDGSHGIHLWEVTVFDGVETHYTGAFVVYEEWAPHDMTSVFFPDESGWEDCLRNVWDTRIVHTRWGDVKAVSMDASHIYYDGATDHAFQVSNDGEYLSPKSYAAFGEDAANAERAYQNWLSRAKQAWQALCGEEE